MPGAREPVRPLRMKVEPKSQADEGRLVAALTELCARDPDLAFAIDPESKEVILAGQDELHLDTAVDAILR